jgi:endonuclease-3
LFVPPDGIEKKRQLLLKAAEALRQGYGVPDPGPLEEPLAVLIRTVLSQNTNDRNRDRAYEALRLRFPRWEDMAEADTDQIVAAIRVGGLAQQKSATIKAILQWVHNQGWGMTLVPLCTMGREEARGVLLGFKGVGLKTANCVLAFGCGHPHPADHQAVGPDTRAGDGGAGPRAPGRTGARYPGDTVAP